MLRLSACLGTHAGGEAFLAPPGTPWLADPVITAWEDQDPEKLENVASALYQLLAAELETLARQGVEVDDLGAGTVGFPTFLEGGDEVRLCFRLGESAIANYRASGVGARAQRPVEGQRFTTEGAAPNKLSR